ncbi:transaldolase family protein [Mesotoga sp.]|uniref:transaldolase family protein n=1 Tax=Mesotoga sp. TaxID=2053577 RepID=UPI00345E634C
MKLFVDDGNVQAISELFDLGFFSGISTNPSILKRTGRKPLEVINDMLNRFTGPLFVQCASRVYDEVLKEGSELFRLDPERIILKIPFSRTGIRVLREFKKMNINTLITGVFSVPQVLMSAEAGADYVAPYANRIENLGIDLSVVGSMQKVLSNGSYKTKLIAASFKTLTQISKMAELPIYGMSLPVGMYNEFFSHSGTLKAIDNFEADWDSIEDREWVPLRS